MPSGACTRANIIRHARPPATLSPLSAFSVPLSLRFLSAFLCACFLLRSLLSRLLSVSSSLLFSCSPVCPSSITTVLKHVPPVAISLQGNRTKPSARHGRATLSCQAPIRRRPGVMEGLHALLSRPRPHHTPSLRRVPRIQGNRLIARPPYRIPPTPPPFTRVRRSRPGTASPIDGTSPRPGPPRQGKPPPSRSFRQHTRQRATASLTPALPAAERCQGSTHRHSPLRPSRGAREETLALPPESPRPEEQGWPKRPCSESPQLPRS